MNDLVRKTMEFLVWWQMEGERWELSEIGFTSEEADRLEYADVTDILMAWSGISQKEANDIWEAYENGDIPEDITEVWEELDIAPPPRPSKVSKTPLDRKIESLIKKGWSDNKIANFLLKKQPL